MSHSVKVGSVMIDPKEGYIFDTIATSSVADSAAETLDINGLDLSSWDDGRGYVNWEHASDGPTKTVGRILYSKKIFKLSDCDNEREKLYWDRAGEHPYVYAVCQLFDQANHPEAVSLAAILRAVTKDGPTHKIGTSIEGSTVSRDKDNPSILRETIGRALAVTVKPANKVCHVGTLADDAAPDNYKIEDKKEDLLAAFADSKKSEGLINPFNQFSVEIDLDTQDNILTGLNKATTAGTYNSAPGSLSGGAALQREFIDTKKPKILEAVKTWGDKPFNKAEFKEFMKRQLPDVSDEFIDHFVDAIDQQQLKNKVMKAEPALSGLDLKVKLDLLDIKLVKAIQDIRNPPETGYTIPLVHKVSVRVGDQFHPAGRYMFLNNRLHHLEDYHGLLQRLLPEGELNEATMARIDGLNRVGDLKIEGSSFDPNQQPQPQPDIEAQQATGTGGMPDLYPVVQPSVFLYQRIGMDKPHILEVHGEEFLLDGVKLEPDEILTIESNIAHGVAILRYKNDLGAQMIKMEALMEGLAKDENMDPGAALQHIRAGVKAGHIHPDVERALTRHIYQDPMSQLGNKYAFQQFMAKKKPGTYLSLDLNDMKALNDTHGHEVGDKAISAYGNAIHESINETVGQGGGKSFRPGESEPDHMGFRSGGDEASVYMPSHEHAVKFARTLHQKLEAMPPINGVHKMSASMGIGHDYDTADKALYAAKAAKKLPNGQRAFPVGKVPNLSHSLHMGHEGPVPLHDAGAEAMYHATTAPKTPGLASG